MPGDEGRTPREIDGYRIHSILDEGAQGVVYLAEMSEPSQVVALKVFHHPVTDAERTARFENEVQALAKMRHRHIARVLRSGKTGSGHPYFAMEYVPGLPLTRYCEEHSLSIEERLLIFEQVCEGVHHAHQRGIIHRDLKPTNILVSEEDGKPVVKVLDFGLARSIDNKIGSQVVITEDGRILGTPEYMSPEQASSQSVDLDIRTDIYSLGVILYELVVGQLPFSSADLRRAGVLEMQRLIREVDPPRPSTRISELGDQAEAVARRRKTTIRGLQRLVSRDLEWVTLTCLEKDRNRRYPAVPALTAELERFLTGHPVEARPPSAGYRLSKWVGRHRVAVGSGLAVFAALAAGLTMTLIFWFEAVRANQRAQLLAHLGTMKLYAAEASGLFPEHSRMLPAIGLWLDKSRALLGHRTGYLQELDRLRANPGSAEASYVETLASIVELMQEFEVTELADVVRRQERIRDVYQRSVVDAKPLWDSVSAALQRHPDFGFAIGPQEGLVPIPEPDPQSGLYEFCHIGTGTVPVRVDGKLRIDGATGIVLVLLPKGSYLMGSQSDDPAAPNYYESPDLRETPPKQKQVEAFFLAKYELTQRQWKRRTGLEPSLLDSGAWNLLWRGVTTKFKPAESDAEKLPVERVSWVQCDQVLTRVGLRLPQEKEWEYAARAGTDSSPQPAELTRYANIADRLFHGIGFTNNSGWTDVDDGFPATAPVDAYEANRWGLHNMLGNVYEWVQDTFTPSRESEYRPEDRVMRGGSWTGKAEFARFAFRSKSPSTNSAKNLGVRPAMTLDRGTTAGR